MSLTAVKFCPAAVMFYMELPGRADYIYCLVSIMRPDLCEVSTPGADTAATVTQVPKTSVNHDGDEQR